MENFKHNLNVKYRQKKTNHKTTEYQYVYLLTKKDTSEFLCYLAKITPSKKNNTKFIWQDYFENIKDAAKAVDLKLISLGMPPVNILVKKV